MTVLLAVDCSLVTPGAALFVDGTLRRAARVRCKVEPGCKEPAARCACVAHKIMRWSTEALGGDLDVSELVVEWPQIYRAVKSKGDPNDLIGIAGVGAALAALLDCPTRSPTPAEWVGQLPKITKGDPWTSPRGSRIAERLTLEERGVCESSHDAIDSVGLGLWALGRFERRRVFPGAT